MLMAHLVYYRTERDKLSSTGYDQPITQVQAIGLTYFLSKKFKVPMPNIIIRGTRCCKFKYPNTIVYVKSRLIAGDVSHEFAHYLQLVKTGKSRHDSRMLTYTKRIQLYVDTLI